MFARYILSIKCNLSITWYTLPEVVFLSLHISPVIIVGICEMYIIIIKSEG